MHELRCGELANTNQAPFNPYYGSIDSTPLFLVLIGEYVKWTDDIELLEMMLPHIRRALEWIDKYGSRDGSGGFVAYSQQSEKGIANQGWKDSGNSVVHRDGAFAKAPIALVEVQGYVYQSKRDLAELLDQLREKSGATDREQMVGSVLKPRRERFGNSSSDSSGSKQTASMHLPWMKRASRWRRLPQTRGMRLCPASWSRKGRRMWPTSCCPRRCSAVTAFERWRRARKLYNPMSYHNGSVWPHDNSLCLLGLNEMGFHNAALTVRRAA